MSDGHAHDVLADLRTPVRALRELTPDAWSAYVHLHSAAMAEGELSTSVKELMALAIAISKECDGCIASHARGAARAGATEAEVAETVAVAMLMNGGPATVFGPRAFEAFQEFAKPAVSTGTA